MLPARIPRSIPKPAPKKREGMSQDHLAFIRTLPCAVCGREFRTTAHHLLKPDDAKQRGAGLRAADKFAIPLCWFLWVEAGCHNDLHKAGDEEAYLASKGIDGRALASALWRVTGDREAALTAIYKARNHG